VINNQRGASVCDELREMCIKLGEFPCIPASRAAKLHCLGIPGKGLRPGSFAFDILSIRAHQFDLLINGEAHGDSRLKGTWKRARDHAIEGTEIRSNETRQSHTFLCEVMSGFGPHRVASNFDRFHA